MVFNALQKARAHKAHLDWNNPIGQQNVSKHDMIWI